MFNSQLWFAALVTVNTPAMSNLKLPIHVIRFAKFPEKCNNRLGDKVAPVEHSGRVTERLSWVGSWKPEQESSEPDRSCKCKQACCSKELMLTSSYEICNEI